MALAKKAAAGLAAGAVGFKILDSKTHISSDLGTARRMLRAVTVLKRSRSTADFTMSDLWAEAVSKHGDNTFVVFEHQRLTYSDMDLFSNQLAHWLLKQGIKRGDNVAMVMENKSEFPAWWLALTKIGVQVALINYAIKQKGLVHCIQVANSAAVVFDADTENSVFDAADELVGLKFLFWGSPRKPFKEIYSVRHDDLLGLPRDGSGFESKRIGLKITDPFGYIYTSGTTGLPKAANITHLKFATMGALVAASGAGPSDRVYTCLPLFHSAGGGIGAVGCIITGATLVLARKFSNARFWPDIMAYGCTGFQYIGELGRYLVNYARENPSVRELNHKLKFAVGNGLRPEVWDEFQDGFKIPLVVEFYGATEGNGVFINFCHRSNTAARGAVGRVGGLLQMVLKPVIAKFDVETEQLVRNADGFCVECGPGEPGELLFPIDKSDPRKQFNGYTDEKATAKKVLNDAFVKGDSWFRTGDLLSRNTQGYYFFVDRIGDTFRWKGENCSTMEISEIVSSLEGVSEANVYGVKVPGSPDGRGCMVAIAGTADLQTTQKLEQLQNLCAKELPPYAQPLFLRFLPQIEVTASFKHQKVQLREDGCDPRRVEDALLWLSPTSRRYEPFRVEDYMALENGRARL